MHLLIEPVIHIHGGILRKIGFSDIADNIYSILLAHDNCSIAELARLTGKYRPAIYKALPELISKRLVRGLVRKKRIVYDAESPLTLSVLFKKQAEDMNRALPELLSEHQRKCKKPKISILEGKDGIESTYTYLIALSKRGEKLYRYESPKNYKRNKQYYPQLYMKRAGAVGDIDKYVITNTETHQMRHKNLNRFSKSIGIPFDENIT